MREVNTKKPEPYNIPGFDIQFTEFLWKLHVPKFWAFRCWQNHTTVHELFKITSEKSEQFDMLLTQVLDYRFNQLYNYSFNSFSENRIWQVHTRLHWHSIRLTENTYASRQTLQRNSVLPVDLIPPYYIQSNEPLVCFENRTSFQCVYLSAMLIWHPRDLHIQFVDVTSSNTTNMDLNP